MAIQVEEIEFILWIRPLKNVFVIVESNVLRITVFQVRSQRDDSLLLVLLRRLHWRNDMVWINKICLLWYLINDPSLISVSLNLVLLLYLLFIFSETIALVNDVSVSSFILSVAFLEDWMINLWLPYLHYPCGRTCAFFYLFKNRSVYLFPSSVWFDWWLIVVGIMGAMIETLLGLTNSTSFSGIPGYLRHWLRFDFIRTFHAIFPHNVFWLLTFQFIIFFVQVWEKIVIVLLNIIEV